MENKNVLDMLRLRKELDPGAPDAVVVDAASVGEPQRLRDAIQNLLGFLSVTPLRLNDDDSMTLSMLIESARAAATQPAQSKSVIKRLAAQGAPATEAKCEHGVLLSMECLNCVEEYVAAPIQATASPASGAQLPDDTVASSGLHEPESSVSALALDATRRLYEARLITQQHATASIIESVFTGSQPQHVSLREELEELREFYENGVRLDFMRALEREEIAITKMVEAGIIKNRDEWFQSIRALDSLAGSDLYRQGERAGIEAAVESIADFDDWEWCKCFECKVDANSHAVSTFSSLANLATAIRALLPAESESGEQNHGK